VRATPLAYANPIRYAGYYFDNETDLYHVRHRSYSPDLQRWIQRDPLSGLTGTFYGYMGECPLRGTDPLGLIPYYGGEDEQACDERFPVEKCPCENEYCYNMDNCESYKPDDWGQTRRDPDYEKCVQDATDTFNECVDKFDYDPWVWRCKTQLPLYVANYGGDLEKCKESFMGYVMVEYQILDNDWQSLFVGNADAYTRFKLPPSGKSPMEPPVQPSRWWTKPVRFGRAVGRPGLGAAALIIFKEYMLIPCGEKMAEALCLDPVCTEWGWQNGDTGVWHPSGKPLPVSEYQYCH